MVSAFNRKKEWCKTIFIALSITGFCVGVSQRVFFTLTIHLLFKFCCWLLFHACHYTHDTKHLEKNGKTKYLSFPFPALP